MIPDKPTIVVDTREKTPWNYEDDPDFAEVVYRKLDYGDYAIDGLEHVCVIERKVGGDELLNNFFTGKQRILAEMERMRACKCPVIIVEQSLELLFNPNEYYINISGKNRRSKYMPPAVVTDGLVDVMIEYGIHVIFGGNDAQKIAKKILLRSWTAHRRGKI